MEQIYDMIVIGGGPAGYTAALYAARSGLSVLVLEKLSAGGQMALTEQIDNYPGFESGIDGFTLGEKMQQSAERFGAVCGALWCLCGALPLPALVRAGGFCLVPVWVWSWINFWNARKSSSSPWVRILAISKAFPGPLSWATAP